MSAAAQIHNIMLTETVDCTVCESASLNVYTVRYIYNISVVH